MKRIQTALTAVAVAFAVPADAQDRSQGSIGGPAAIGNDEQIIYRIVGARDDGGLTLAGNRATLIDCTNFSGITETIGAVARTFDSTVVANKTLSIGHLQTRTFATHFPLGVNVDQNLATGVLNQGTIAIAATSINIVCNAVVLDPANARPIGYSLRAIRFNPVPAGQE